MWTAPEIRNTSLLCNAGCNQSIALVWKVGHISVDIRGSTWHYTELLFSEISRVCGVESVTDWLVGIYQNFQHRQVTGRLQKVLCSLKRWN